MRYFCSTPSRDLVTLIFDLVILYKLKQWSECPTQLNSEQWTSKSWSQLRNSEHFQNQLSWVGRSYHALSVISYMSNVLPIFQFRASYDYRFLSYEWGQLKTRDASKNQLGLRNKIFIRSMKLYVFHSHNRLQRIKPNGYCLQFKSVERASS